MYEKFKDFQPIIVAVIICFSALIAAAGVVSTLKQDSISVTGSAFKIVKSDSAILKLEIKSRMSTKSAANEVIRKQLPVIKNFLNKEGISEKEISLLPIDAYTINKYDPKLGYNTNDIEGYNLTQTIVIKSDDVDKINKLSLNATSLLDSGIDINVNPPEYYYSKLGEIKVELLKEASKDAKLRAKGMLAATNNNVGKIKSVKMGVFQITPSNSTEVSDYGMNDNSSIEKKVTAVANVTFSIK